MASFVLTNPRYTIAGRLRRVEALENRLCRGLLGRPYRHELVALELRHRGVAPLVAAVFIELEKIPRGDHLVLADLHLAERVGDVFRLETPGRIQRPDRHHRA